MSTPILESIAVDIEAAVNAITVANGFNYTLTAIRPKTITYKVTPNYDKVVVIKQGTRSPIGSASLVLSWEQIFELTCWVTESEIAVTSIETKTNQIVADIEKKLKEDVQRGDNAYNTRLLGADPLEDEAGTGAIVTVAVDYKVSETDPYTKG
jgi:hypothetical protein